MSVTASGSHQVEVARSTASGEESGRSSSLSHAGSTYQKVNWYSCPLLDCRGLEQVMVHLWGAELLACPTSLCCLSLGQGPGCDGQGRQIMLPQGVKVNEWSHNDVTLLHVY